MVILPQSVIGRHFVAVEPGEVICGHYQYLNMMTGRWKMSTYSAKENYTNSNMSQAYRKPANFIGWIIITPRLIEKYFFKVVRFFMGRK